MACYACSADAVDRCYTCGRLYCEKHGGTHCTVCQSSIQPGDPSPERISETRPRIVAASAWWRPQQAEDFEPPSCYVCHGLSRAICSACGRRYCAEHAGRNFTCKECGKTGDLSLLIVGGFLIAFVLIGVIGYWVSQ